MSDRIFGVVLIASGLGVWAYTAHQWATARREQRARARYLARQRHPSNLP